MRYFTLIALIASLAWAACDGEAPLLTQTTEPRILSSPTAVTETPAVTPYPTSPTPVPATVTPSDATSTPMPSRDSGINGTVTIGPTCPVQRIDSACPDRPYEVTISVLDDARREVAETRSDSSGRFRLRLGPGVYTLRPPQTGAPPGAAERTVVVVEGRFTEVQIVFDSGIR